MRIPRLLIFVLAVSGVRAPLVGQTGANMGPKPSDNQKLSGSTSQIQIVYQPADIVADGSGNDGQTTLAIRAVAAGLKGPKIVSGNFRDENSLEQLPPEAFELIREDGKNSDQEISTSDLTRISIRLKKDWQKAGKYSGNLWIGAIGDTAAQSVVFKVSVRPRRSWLYGFLCITAGAGVSWFALFWVARRRQVAANEVLIARLQLVVDSLLKTLQTMTQAGAPRTPRSIAHLDTIRDERLPELKHDKELSVVAGVSAPSTGSISVTDELDGMNRIVRNGFEQLFQLWIAPGANQANLGPLFGEMDLLGEVAQPLSSLDGKIQAILAKSAQPAARVLVNGQFPPLPSEDSIVRRIVITTYLLDLLSVATVVAAGMYVIVWKNPGFGTIGDYFEGFFWGLGLKIGSDLSKLGPGDVRTSFGIKTPAP